MSKLEETQRTELSSRWSGILDMEYAKNRRILVVGCGGLGANAVRMLARTGFSNGITVVDDDRVSMHNVYPQGFDLKEVDKLKVRAVQEYCHDQLGVQITGWPNRVTSSCIRRTLDGASDGKPLAVVSAVDNMETRKLVANACLRHEDVDLLIDPRMGGLYGILHVLRVKQAKDEQKNKYLSSLHTDGEGTQLPCSERATPFCAMTLACFTVMAIVQHANPQGTTETYLERHLDMPDLRCFVMK